MGLVEQQSRQGMGPASPLTPRRIARIEARTLWLAAAIVVVLGLGWIVLSKGLEALLLLFVAVVFAEGIRPLVGWLQKRGLPRPAAVLLIYVLLVGVVGGLTWALLQPLLSQGRELIVQLPRYVAQAQHVLRDVGRSVGVSVPGTAGHGGLSLPQDLAGQVGPTLLAAPVLLVDLLFRLVLVLLMAFFWLTASSGLKPFLLSLLPRSAQPAAADTTAEMSQRVGGYAKGVAINMAVVAALSAGGLALLGMPYALLLGLVAGLAETLPIVGPWIAGAVAVTVALVSGGLIKAAEVLALYVAIHLIEGNTLVPVVMHRATGLNPLVVVLAVTLGGVLLGVAGAVLGVPAAVIIQVLVLRVLAPAARRAAAPSTP